MRDTVARAIAAGLTTRQWRVLAAVLCLTTSYSRLDDHTNVEQVAGLSGLHPRDASRELNRLHRLGVIVWEPTRGGRGRKSHVSVKPRADCTPVSDDETRAQSNGNPGAFDTKPRVPVTPTTEKVREEDRGAFVPQSGSLDDVGDDIPF